jgi:hypothetical protein
LSILEQEIYRVLPKGRKVMESLGGGIEREHGLKSRDVLAFSGPVPFSRAYGAAVV